jgi:hypothetical protein
MGGPHAAHFGLAMNPIPYIKPGTYLFRFLNPSGPHFWPTITALLSEQMLILNSRRNFNDPFDSQPEIVNDVSSSALRAYLDDALQHPFNSRRSLASVARIMELKATGRTTLDKRHLENIKAGLHKSAEEILDAAGLLSFSLTAENPVLWGHYSASSTGICAVFRRGTSQNSGLSVCARVAYVDKRPQLPLSLIHEMTRRRMAHESYDDLVNQIFFLSFLHKSTHWAYEQEARIFHTFHAFKKLPFDSSEFVGFILGPRSSEELGQKIRGEIKRRRPSTGLDRSMLSATEFRIIIPHKFVQHHSNAA